RGERAARCAITARAGRLDAARTPAHRTGYTGSERGWLQIPRGGGSDVHARQLHTGGNAAPAIRAAGDANAGAARDPGAAFAPGPDAGGGRQGPLLRLGAGANGSGSGDSACMAPRFTRGAEV